MRITLVLFFSLFFVICNAQADRITSKACGTEINQRQMDLVQTRLSRTPVSRVFDGSLIDIAVTPHIIRRSDGSGGLSESNFEAALQNVNDYYLNAGMAFFVLGGINYIDDDELYDFTTGNEGSMGAENDVANTINIYFANSVGNGSGSFYCGYTTFPGGPDRILMDNSCAINGSTLPHEIGHYFTLYHTHGKTNSGTTDELVDGSNCATAGDDVCDTPADPNLSGKVDGACNYTGTDTDPNGSEYVPNTHNIMSYSRKSCRDFFSEGQFDRIFSGYNNFRTYLISEKYFADFEPQSKIACTGSPITFESTSVGAVSYTWTFEGGSPATSNLANPVVTYANTGFFDVTLTITAENSETDEKIVIDAVEIIEPSDPRSSVIADFEEAQEEQYDIINPDADITFEISTLASKSFDRSIYVNFYDYESQGQQDYLVLDNLTPGNNYELKFYYAYTYYGDDFQDRLEVISRTACTENWETLWDYSGAELATAPSTTNLFVPTPDQWREVVIPLSPIPGEPFQVAFRTTSGWGNSLFIDSISIASEEPLQILEVELEDITCFGSDDGKISIVALEQGETISYSLDDANYQETGVFENLDAAEYNIYVKSTSGESTIVTVALSEPDLLELLIDVEPPTCPDSQNGSIELNASGGVGNYVFSFEDELVGTQSITGLTVDVFVVSVEDDNGCDAEQEINLLAANPFPEQPVITYDSDRGVLQINSTSLSIQWLHDSEEILDGGSSNSLNSIGPGFYQVAVTSDAGCVSVSDPFTIASTYADLQSSFELYPSPSSDIVNIVSDAQLKSNYKENIRIIDQHGRVQTTTLNSLTEGVAIDVSNFSPGIYTVQILTDGNVFSKKFVVE